jgi:vacuolar-type H+-ATPase subunit C/Vma6
MTAWIDVVARARGLGTHLLPRRELDALVHAPDLAVLGAELRRAGFPIEEGERSPAALELAVRRRAAAALRILSRWCGPRTEILTVVFEDEDRRSLRAMLRGAVQGAPPDARLAGLVPSPALPERSLGELARQGTAGAVAVLLTAWGNPYGPVLRAPASAAYPDLLKLEMLVNRTFAQRALAGALRAGGGGRRGELVAYVQDSIDLENAATAVALVGAVDVVAKDLFLPGGRLVTIDVFETAPKSLAVAFAGSPFAAVFRAVRASSALLEDDLLRARIAALRAAARHHPLGPAPVLHFALRLRAETLDLSRTVWGLALGAPRPLLAEAILAPT